MRIVAGAGIALALALLGGCLFPTVSLAQAGFDVTPSFSVAEVYDDNLFATASRREKDFISRFNLGILGSYQSRSLTLQSNLAFDAEVFADHPELNNAQARREASIDYRYLPTPVLTVSAKGAFSETQRPKELNVETGLEGGRGRADQFSFSPSIAYQFDPLTAGSGAYSFTRNERAGGVSTDIHTANLSLTRRITPQDSGNLGYTFGLFLSGDDDPTTSHAFTLGWTREISPVTQIALQGGPRFSEGTVDAQVSASITRKLAQGVVSFAYRRSLTTVIGEAGTATTDSFSAALRYEPLRLFRVNAAISFIRSTRAEFEAKVYGVNLDMTYRITQWLSLIGSYQFSLQQGTLGAAAGTAAGREDEILHNVVLLRLAATYPAPIF